MIMREIHVHIPAGLTEDQVIHIHLDDAQPASPEDVEPAIQEQDMEDTVEGMVRRLEASPSGSSHLRRTLSKLQGMGYELRLPELVKATGPREKYVRIIDPASPSQGVGYVRPGFLIFTRVSDQERLARLPGALVRGGNGVKFAIDGKRELDAAGLVKR
jgi:hypothetical protein